MSEPRIAELESRYALLEQQVAELSEVLWRQQRELDGLRAAYLSLREKLQGDPGLVDASRDDKPPHY